MDDARGAAVVYQRLLARSQHWADLDPKNTFWQRNLAISHGKVAQAQAALGDLPAAIAGLRHATALIDALLVASPDSADLAGDLAETQVRLGDVYLRRGDRPAARAAYGVALKARRALAAADPGNPERAAAITKVEAAIAAVPSER
mgnify:CR=1 FL=1